MSKVNFSDLRRFLKKNYGIDTTRRIKPNCLVCSLDELPSGLSIDLALRGYYVHKSIIGKYIIYQR